VSQQEFETYLALLTRLLRINPQQREQVAEEFRSHMEDRLDDLLARGISREQAIQTALEEFGDAAALAGQVASISWTRKRRWYMKVSAFSVAGLAAAVLLAVALWPENQRLPATGRAIAQQPAGGDEGAADVGAAQPDVKATLEQKLAQRLDADFLEFPLRDVLAFLADQAQVQFYINRRALDDEAASDDAPISLKLKNVRLETVLDLALEQANPNLAYQERDGVLMISTLQALEGATEVRVYNCRDLLAMTSPDPAEMMMGGAGGGMEGMRGMGDMMMRGMPGMGAGMGMPGMMRGGRGRAGAGGDAPVPAADPSAPGDGGAGAAAPGEVPQPADPPTTKSDSGIEPGKTKRPKGREGAHRAPSLDLWQDRAILAQAAGGGMGGAMGGMGSMMGGDMGMASRPEPRTDHERRAERLMRLITTAVDPDSWQDTGGFGTISEFEGLIVVNHSARTHKEIEKVLTMLREAAGLPLDAQGGSMGGAGMMGGFGGGFGAGGGAAVPSSP
jgi:hypothetical protein